MRTHYDHVTCHQTGALLNDRPRFVVKNVSAKLTVPATLGLVLWHAYHQRYVFQPYEADPEGRVQLLTCEQLRDIATFIETQL